jgi:hypothetical protein
MANRKAVAAVLSLLATVALVALAQTPLSYSKDIEPIFVGACADCHGDKHPKADLDLSLGSGLAALTGKKSSEVDMPLLTPGDPAASYLWLKLSHTATQGRGMPRTLFGAKKLPKEQLDLVQRWIVEGAKP